MAKKIEKEKKSMETVGKRLKSWRKSKAYRLVDLSKRIGVSQGSLSDLENDKSLPSATTLAGLCLHADVNICWLLTGRGSVLRETNGDDSGIFSDAEFMLSLQNTEIRELVEQVIRIFRFGKGDSKSRLSGFLTGADPGK
ncbi:MAG: helix-turn-helix transcriptional regulator [Nitrospinaceae bacterium]